MIFGFLVLGGGIISYLESTGIFHLIAGSGSGLSLVVGGLGVLKRKEFWLVFAPFLAVVAVLFFTHSFIVSDQLIVPGAMAIIGIIALFLFYRELSARESQ